MSTLTELAHLDGVLDERTTEILERRRPGGRTVHRRGWLVRRALLTADVVGLTGAFGLAEVIYARQVHHLGTLSPFVEWVTFVVSLPLWVVAIKLYGLYDRDEERADHSTTDDFARMFHLLTVCTFLLYAGSRLTQVFNPQFSKLFTFWLIAVLGSTSLRAVARAYCRRQMTYLQNAIIVGAGDVGQMMARKLLKHPEYGINLVGFVDDYPKERADDLEHLSILGSAEQLAELVELLDVERVIFAFSNDSHEASLSLIRELNRLMVQIDIVPRFFDVLGPHADIHSVEGLAVWGLRPYRLPVSSKIVKRAFDVIVASLGLIVLAPILAILAVAIRLDSAGSPFFAQERIGAQNKKFRIWKFRTMSADADLRKQEIAHLNKHLLPGGDPRMFKIDDDPRVTRLGKHLRRCSIDELPQLVNVLRGDMSIVGPRPLIPEENRHIRDWGEVRLDLRPGITGLWQVLGRDEIGFAEMVRLDYLYVTSWSLMFDVQLLLRTIPVVLRGGARERSKGT